MAIQQHLKKNIVFVRNLPTLKQIESFVAPTSVQSIVIYDRILLKNSSFKKWLAQFQFKIPVQAGEKLKTLDQYGRVLAQIQKWHQQGLVQTQLQFIAIGGGSVGDFVGFLAATYQRGRPLISIPSTWLSVIDSAHGGKNGLNLNGVKNQIGTITQAKGVIICKALLDGQPKKRIDDALGEIIKIILIDQPQKLTKLKMTDQYIWKNLEYFIQAKMKVVQKDPEEKKGLRHVLNLGHTMGHVFETQLGLSHGVSVALGLVFCVRWSYSLKLISLDQLIMILRALLIIPEVEKQFKNTFKLSEKQILTCLKQDKKKAKQKSKIRFVFISDKKKTIILEKTFDEIIDEYRRQRFVMI